MGVDTFTILDYYMKEVRVHLELAVPVWQSGLTYKLTADIERVQRVAVGILTGGVPYAEAFANLGFMFKGWSDASVLQLTQHLTKADTKTYLNLRRTLGGNAKFKEHTCCKSRFYKSPLPYLTRILNDV